MQRSRRQFVSMLAAGGVVAGSGVLSSSLWAAPSTSTAKAAAHRRVRTVIWVELKGGNDGLNMLPPIRNAVYRRARPQLALGDDDVFAFDGGVSLHRGLLGLEDAVGAGEVAAVVGVGYRPANRSHFRSIQIWDQACAAHEVKDTGWMTRVLAAARQHQLLPTMNNGLSALDGVVVRGDDGPLEAGHTLHLNGQGTLKSRRRAPSSPASPSPSSSSSSSAIAHIEAVRADLAAQTAALAAKLQALSVPSTSTTLPPKLQGVVDVAARVAILGASGDHSVPVVKLTLPGFDTHTNQQKVQGRLLGELGAGLSALRQQLRAAGAWNDTVVVVMSEFGRRVKENNNGGTDHGAAAPVVVMGGAVRGGLVGGAWDLDDLDDGDVRARVSHRDVFAAVAAGAFGLDADAIDAALPPLPGIPRARLTLVG